MNIFRRRSATSEAGAAATTATDTTTTPKETTMTRFTDDELRQRLSTLQYRVTQDGGTERPFTGEYWDTKADGSYRCLVCDAELFSSAAKYDSGSGWPSFFEEASEGAVRRIEDRSLGMRRIEARCAGCDAHLGHVFPDGPHPTGERYCMNSASLRLDTEDSPSEA